MLCAESAVKYRWFSRVLRQPHCSEIVATPGYVFALASHLVKVGWIPVGEMAQCSEWNHPGRARRGAEGVLRTVFTDGRSRFPFSPGFLVRVVGNSVTFRSHGEDRQMDSCILCLPGGPFLGTWKETGSLTHSEREFWRIAWSTPCRPG